MDIFKILGTIGVNNTAANAAIDQTTRKAETGSAKMVKAFKRIAAGIVSAYSVTKVIQFGKACVDAYNAQEEAELKLETIMKQRMGSTDKQIQQIKDYTSALQQQGVVGDEVQLAGAQQLSTFLNSEKALKSLIPAMNNLAVQQNGVNVTSENMVGLGNMMGKVMQGQVGALTRVGITFTEAQEKALKYGTEEEKAAVLAQVITDNVGEMNKVFAQTDEGKIQQAKNTFSDLQEVIGARLIPFLGDLAVKANTAGRYLIDNFDKVVNIVKTTAKSLTVAGAALVAFKAGKGIYGLIRAFQTAKVHLSLYKLESGGASIAQGILNRELTKGQTATALLTKQTSLGAIAKEAYSGTILQARVQQVAETAAKIRATAATKMKAAADVIATSRVWAYVAANRAAMLATLGLAAPIVLIAGYMLKTGKSADETAEMITQFANKLAEGITQFANKLPEMINAIMPAITAMIQSIVTAIPKLIVPLVNAGLTLFMALVDCLPKIIPPLVAAIPQVVTAVCNALIVLVPALLKAGVILFKALVKAVPQVAKALLKALPQIVKAVQTGLAKALPKVWDSIKKTAVAKWKSIVTAILKPVQSMRDKIKAIIDKIKGFFKFKVSIPHIPLPKFSLSPAGWKLGDLVKGKIPKLSVAWHAEGGIFNKPTIFETAKGLHGVGEAGAEAITPISKLQEYVTAAVAEQNRALIDALKAIEAGRSYAFNIATQVDGKTIAAATAKYTQAELSKLQTRSDRLQGVRA